MRITEIEIRCCRHQGPTIPADVSCGGNTVDGLEFVLDFTLTTPDLVNLRVNGATGI